MSGISTHVLDLVRGRPAAGVAVRLEADEPGRGWVELAAHVTDADGRVRELLPQGRGPQAGRYRARFETGAWFASRGETSFHPEVAITFHIADPAQHHHVPLLLAPYGYSTYRGS